MVHQVEEADLETAAAVLARAMLQYPVFAYVVPGASSPQNGLIPIRASETAREGRLRHVLRCILAVAAFHGEIVAPTRDIEAVAVWIRSDKSKLSLSEAVRAGFLTLPLKAGLPTVSRLLDLAKRKHEQRKKIMKQPYYLLDMLGVDPRHQNKGYGRLLLETKLEDLDREQAQCYLETSDERNIGYYQRYGFELIHQHWIEDMPVYCLLRSGQNSPRLTHNAAGQLEGVARQ